MPEEARLKRMRDVLRHRGLEGEGLWIEGPMIGEKASRGKCASSDTGRPAGAGVGRTGNAAQPNGRAAPREFAGKAD